MDLAVKMTGKIDVTNISRIEAGRTNPTVFTLYRIANALEVNTFELLNFNEPEPDNKTDNSSTKLF